MVTNRSISIAVTARDKLFTVDEYLTSDECDLMSSYVTENTDRSFDRSEYQVNLGVNGDSGKYHSFLICQELAPDLWRDVFSQREVNGIPLDSVMVNIYKQGDFIPPHKDKQGSIYTITVPLQTSDDSLVFSENDKLFYNSDDTDNDMVICKDNRGTGYGFYGNSPLHWVPKVKQKSRVTLICLYGAMTY